MMRLLFFAFCIVAFISGAAFAQNGQVVSSGPFTPGHTVRCTNGTCTVVTDAGGSAAPTVAGKSFLTEFNVMGTSCWEDGYNNVGLSPNGYHQLCINANALGGGLLAYNAYAGASALPLLFQVNGSVYQFPFTNGNVVGPNSSTVGDIAVFNNTAGTLIKDSGVLYTSIAPLNSPAFTGTPTAPTPGSNISTTQIPTTAWVNNWFAPLASPALTGTPTAPTAATNTDTSQIATTAFVQNSLSSIEPLLTKIASTETANYTAANSDAHTIIYLTSGGSGGQTLTVNALTSYSDAAYAVGFCNEDSRVWNVSSADAGSLKLYPGQCNALTSNGSALKYYLPKTRYRVANAVIYMGPSGSCSDSNDGLAATTGGQVCSGSTAVAIIQQDLDNLGTVPTIQVADGTYSQTVGFAGTITGGGDQIQLTGDQSTPSNVVFEAPSGQPAFDVEDLAIMTLNGIEIACTNSTSEGVFARQNATVDLAKVILGSCDNNNAFVAQEGGHVNDISNGLTLDGNANIYFLSTGAGSTISISGVTITCSGSNASGTAFVQATQLAEVAASSLSFSGCSGQTGVRWLTSYNSVIQTGASCNSLFPGNSNGTASDNSLCE